MILGSFERFLYFQCLECGCLQIGEIPSNIADYYRHQYHARILELQAPAPKAFSELCKRKAAGLLLSAPIGEGAIPWPLRKIFPGFLWQFRELGLRLDSPILDYGCGRAHLLLRLRKWGFRRLFGLDPYLPAQELVEEGITLRKGDWTILRGSFDLLILNHVIEHLEEPLTVLKALREHLAPGGTMLVSTPVADSYGWRKFGNSWAMWDPPRHLHLFTAKAMAIGAGRCGLRVAKVKYDAGKNLWATSQFFALHPERKVEISQEELTERQRPIRKWAQLLDEIGDSDMATFYLKAA
ncbi:class I SAM-dependent methyltransferase [Methylacidimicrobium cyclopophantes]|nr:class I SAM-dependent methyltransferase [Methylacidimicrobium cyclopophantes]